MKGPPLRAPGAGFEGREPAKPLTAERDGFSLNAAVACQADDRRKLARSCRYVARPAIAHARLSRDGDGLVVYELKHPFRDGTTHVRRSRASMRFAALGHHLYGMFESLDFMAKPSPAGGIRTDSRSGERCCRTRAGANSCPDEAQAQRLCRVFDIDVSRCSRSGAVETGNHESLLARGGLYRQLASAAA